VVGGETAAQETFRKKICPQQYFLACRGLKLDDWLKTPENKTIVTCLAQTFSRAWC